MPLYPPINQPTTKYFATDRREPIADHWRLLQGATATGPGQWSSVPLNKSASAATSGTNSGVTTQILGSNEDLPNDTTDSGFVIGTITGNGVLNWSYPVRWVKANVTAIGSGAVNCDYLGVA